MTGRIALTVLCLVCVLLSGEAIADYGDAFLSIRCDQKTGTFEVEPLIIWNEELDALAPAVKKKGGKVKRNGAWLHFSGGRPNLNESCSFNGVRLRVVMENAFDPHLDLYENDQLVGAPLVGNVWEFYGYIFKVRYTKAGRWEEQCGPIEAINEWKPLTESVSTQIASPQGRPTHR